ncbi:Peptidase family M23 [Flavobacterium sp. 9AF]|uniref:M23 family metallopeptidase n=1 Tax=Flavobacterium sp. 9AF TaxID=2653142 RepID=UPI0012F3DDDE|nr:M23 family metallopeptidase [Flavobacterium sp. 9AF]VXC33345.1 Peptidase family M23 [Flavobacterium sp. 9AF]
MKKILIIAFIITTSICKAQDNIKVYYEKIDNGYNIYADNDEFCPVSFKLDFNVTNLTIEEGNNNLYVVDSKSKKQLLTTLKALKIGKPYNFSFTTWANYGNCNKKEYDENYVYDLPFKNSNKFKIIQGYNGTFSHQNKNALDFSMPIGTELTAIREGVVIKVVENNNKHCTNKECEKYNNLIMIYHLDGTFAVYAHIKQNGSKVKVGDQVSKGQLIGYSGNVGYSSKPHLHLVVYKNSVDGMVTFKTKFRIEDGTKIEFLIEGSEYLKGY